MNKFKIWITFLTLLLTTPIWAAEADAEKESALNWAIENIVLVMGSAVVVSALLFLYGSAKLIWKSQTIGRFEAQGLSHEVAIKKAKNENFWAYIYQQLDGGVSLEKETDILLHHNYDGIQELDNNLPPWWKGMFYASIAFGPIYIGIYHFSDIGKLQIAEYEQEVREAGISIAAFNAAQKAEKTAELTADNVTVLSDKDRLAAGQANFKTYCVACHGMLGEGIENLGQNLTDKYWIQGGGVKNIFKTISEGVPGKPMVAWKAALSATEIQELASYILTLEGTDPPNARPPEGELYEEGTTSETPQSGETEVGIK